MVFEARRVVSAEESVAAPQGVGLDSLSLSFPLVVQFLTLAAYGDGSRRVPGSITLFSDNGVLKACLNDKDGPLNAFVTGAGLGGLLESMERGLEQDRLDWRGPRAGKKRR